MIVSCPYHKVVDFYDSYEWKNIIFQSKERIVDPEKKPSHSWPRNCFSVLAVCPFCKCVDWYDSYELLILLSIRKRILSIQKMHLLSDIWNIPSGSLPSGPFNSAMCLFSFWTTRVYCCQFVRLVWMEVIIHELRKKERKKYRPENVSH